MFRVLFWFALNDPQLAQPNLDTLTVVETAREFPDLKSCEEQIFPTIVAQARTHKLTGDTYVGAACTDKPAIEFMKGLGIEGLVPVDPPKVPASDAI